MVRYILKVSIYEGRALFDLKLGNGNFAVRTIEKVLELVNADESYNVYYGFIKGDKFIYYKKEIDNSLEYINTNDRLEKYYDEEKATYFYNSHYNVIYKKSGSVTTIGDDGEDGLNNTHIDLTKPHLYFNHFDMDFITIVLIDLEEKDKLTQDMFDRISNYIENNPTANINLNHGEE